MKSKELKIKNGISDKNILNQKSLSKLILEGTSANYTINNICSYL